MPRSPCTCWRKAITVEIKIIRRLSQYFETYYTTYPKGEFTELSRFYSGYGLYLDSPDPR